MFGIDDLVSGVLNYNSAQNAAEESRRIAAMQVASQEKMNEKNIELTKESWAHNDVEASKQRDWEKDMSSTAYQRAMADMKKAGLNPILAYSQGGASTPSGAVSSGTPAHVESTGEAAGKTLNEGNIRSREMMQKAVDNAISSALESYKTSIENKKANAGINYDIASAENQEAQKDYYLRSSAVKSKELDRINEEVKSIKLENRKTAGSINEEIEAEREKARLEAQGAKVERNPWVMGATKILQKIGFIGPSAVSGAMGYNAGKSAMYKKLRGGK